MSGPKQSRVKLQDADGVLLRPCAGLLHSISRHAKQKARSFFWQLVAFCEQWFARQQWHLREIYFRARCSAALDWAQLGYLSLKQSAEVKLLAFQRSIVCGSFPLSFFWASTGLASFECASTLMIPQKCNSANSTERPFLEQIGIEEFYCWFNIGNVQLLFGISNFVLRCCHCSLREFFRPFTYHCDQDCRFPFWCLQGFAFCCFCLWLVGGFSGCSVFASRGAFTFLITQGALCSQGPRLSGVGSQQSVALFSFGWLWAPLCILWLLVDQHELFHSLQLGCFRVLFRTRIWL